MARSRINVGLDAGGTKTDLRAERDGGSEVVETRGAGANPNRVGIESAANVIIRLVKEALSELSSAEKIQICAGVSGAGREDVQTKLSNTVRTAFNTPEQSVGVEVVHDGLIAIDAAYDTGSGIVVIAGTGSVILARAPDGRVLHAGGWGPVLGDPGSGTAVGREGLRAVAEAFDGGRDTELCAYVRDRFEIVDRDALIRAVYTENLDLHEIAPTVIEAAVVGDPVADDILSTQALALTEQVEWLLGQEGDISQRITVLGGLARTDYYGRVLRRALSNQFPDGSIGMLRDDPVLGALRRARRRGRK